MKDYGELKSKVQKTGMINKTLHVYLLPFSSASLLRRFLLRRFQNKVQNAQQSLRCLQQTHIFIAIHVYAQKTILF